MLTDQYVFIELLRKQICLEQPHLFSIQCDERKDLSERLQSDQEDQLPIELENSEQEHCSDCKATESFAHSRESSPFVLAPTQSNQLLKDVTTYWLNTSQYQLDIVVRESSSKRGMKVKPLFRMYIPARVLALAKQLMKKDDEITITNALQEASALFGYNLEDKTAKSDMKTCKQKRDKTSTSLKRKRKVELESSEARINRVNGHLNQVLARRPSWCDLEEGNQSISQSEVTPTRLHPKKSCRRLSK